MFKKAVLISLYELNPNTGLYVSAVAVKDADEKVKVSFYMGESVISAQFLYGILCDDLEFSQSALYSYLVEWFKVRSYSMYLDYYSSVNKLEL